jgi:hypothetical protein
MNGGLEMRTTPVISKHTISVLKKPHGSRRNRKDMIITNTGELKMMVVASPSGRRRNVKNRRTSVEPPTIPCQTDLHQYVIGACAVAWRTSWNRGL